MQVHDSGPERGPRTTMNEQQIKDIWVQEPPRRSGPVTLIEYDPAWPATFATEAEQIRSVLGDRVLRLEHIGSTAVPGLAAKPIIDMLLVVSDPADEPAYAEDLVAAGYPLVIREPDWYEHRAFKGPGANINLHVHGPASPEIRRHLVFRDWLRVNDADRDLYERTKRELAGRQWQYIQNYADAKTAVIEAIYARAKASAHPAKHDSESPILPRTSSPTAGKEPTEGVRPNR